GFVFGEVAALSSEPSRVDGESFGLEHKLDGLSGRAIVLDQQYAHAVLFLSARRLACRWAMFLSTFHMVKKAFVRRPGRQHSGSVAPVANGCPPLATSNRWQRPLGRARYRSK